VRGAGDPAGDARQRHGTAAARQADLVGHAGDRAHGGEVGLVARDEQHALLTGDVDRERDVHGGKDDGVFERYEQQGGHVRRGFLR
jgi:hypothetical protein